jgi:hypothetical protein
VLANRVYQHALVSYFDNQYPVNIRIVFQSNRRNEHDVDELEDLGRIDGSKSQLLLCMHYAY